MPGTEDSTSGDDTPQVYIGAYALCIEDTDRLLLCRIAPGYPDEGQWTLPGGGLAWGEQPELGVLRELQEETGLTAKIDEVARIYSHAYFKTRARPAASVHHLGLIYRVSDLRGEVQAEAEGSTDHCAWLTQAEVEKLSLVPLAEFALPLAWP